MKILGVDIGSRTTKIVILNNEDIILTKKEATSHNPLNTVSELIKDIAFDTMVATGYGRHLIGEYYKCLTISEIKAFALGAKSINPECKTILDIGGQDTKAIGLNDNGDLSKFEMNDRCAAGTGRFIEIMANVLGFSLSEFSNAAITARKAESISSMCTVFAESEVISLIAKGAKRNEVALGIHRAILSRVITLLKRVYVPGKLFFAGGVAFNECMRKLIADELKYPVFVPEDPQIVGALGAAIYGNKII